MADKFINMIMLGPSRVGKSSLLATMYKEIARMGTGFDFLPVGETSDQLNEAYYKLNAVMKTPVFTDVENLLKGNEGFVEHRFKVCFHGIKEFDLIFHDYRGGVLMKSGSDKEAEAKQDHETLKRLVAQSHVIFNVLDAVALMEVDSVKSDELTVHTRVYELLHDTLQGREKYLVVFVLIKCETYVKTASERERLANRFEERHRSVLRLIQRLNETNKNVAALLIPAITLGCVEFKEIDLEGSFVFERNHKDFEPREVDQPLRYALSFALNHVNRNRWWWEKLRRTLTGHSKAFGQALKDFYSQADSNYKKYGNEALLEVK